MPRARLPFTLMMVKKLMSLHNSQMRHKNLWKMKKDELYEYIRTQGLKVVALDDKPYVKLEPLNTAKRNKTIYTEFVDKEHRLKGKSYVNPGTKVVKGGKKRFTSGTANERAGRTKQLTKYARDKKAHAKEKRDTRNDPIPKRQYAFKGAGAGIQRG